MRLARITLLVHDQDEAIAWFTEKLGLRLVADTPMPDGRRWVAVAPDGGGAELLLAQAMNDIESAAVGLQAAKRAFLFLETDDFARDHAAMIARGVLFLEQPRHEAYGTVALFSDLYGNLWDLIQPAG